MTVTVYKSTDASAPVLTGEVGSLNALLYACLVTGYGAKPGAGWTRAFNDAPNYTSVFLQGSGSSGRYLRVDDGGPGTGAAKEARATGYETMSDVDTGTNPFPSAAASPASYTVIRKSTTADATARAWKIFADHATVYVFLYSGDTAGEPRAFAFGDIYSFMTTTDDYRCAIIGRSTENSGLSGTSFVQTLVTTLAVISQSWVCRSYTGVGTSVQFGKHVDTVKNGAVTRVGGGGESYPASVNNGILFGPVYVHELNKLRGRMRGFWCLFHNLPLADGDTFTGTGDMTGRSFEAVMGDNSSQYLIETTGWG